MNEQAAIYWRRRMVAISGVVIALAIVGWAAGGFFGGNSSSVQGASGNVRDSQPPSSPPPPSSGSPNNTTSSSPSSPSPTTSTPPPPPPPDPNQPCPDASMQLAVELGAPQYKVGQRPELKLVVTNAGQVPCTREISRSLREILVTSQDGGTRLWSSNDCSRSNLPPESQIMQPGERLGYDVRWAGRTSAPSCPVKRTTVQAGTYAVIGKLGALTSPAVPIVLV
jgi:hypothetical protein